MNTFEAIRLATREYLKLSDWLTYEHHGSVMEISREIAMGVATHYGLSNKQVYLISSYSAFHDIGKVAIPQGILIKPLPLTAEEKTLIRTHSARGAELIDNIVQEIGAEQIADVDMLRNVVFQHHERLDGSGYPLGLKGDEISIEARIVMVADAYDAMISERPYQRASSHEWAMSELREEVRLGKMCGVCVDALEQHYGKG